MEYIGVRAVDLARFKTNRKDCAADFIRVALRKQTRGNIGG